MAHPRNGRQARRYDCLGETYMLAMQGFVSEETLSRTLTDSGGIDRCDTVTDLLNPIPPSGRVKELTQADGLLRQVMDLLREAEESPDQG